MRINGPNGPGKREGTCVVRYSGVDGTYTKSVSVCADVQTICTPGKLSCGYDSQGRAVVRECSLDGSNQIIKDTCSQDQVCRDAECVSKSGGGSWIGDLLNKIGLPSIAQLFTGDIFSNILGWIMLVAIVIISIIIIILIIILLIKILNVIK